MQNVFNSEYIALIIVLCIIITLSFYLRWYVWSRLSSERATSSPSESAAIIFATMECLRFIILQNAGDEQEQRSIQNMLISEQVYGSQAKYLSKHADVSCIDLFLHSSCH